MATGILGTPSDLAATTDTVIYTVPAGYFSVITINVTNRSATAATARVALSAADTPTAAEYIEYDTTILGNGVLERGGVVVDAGTRVVVRSSTTDMSAMVFGIETATS